jgi:2,4-diaminopentanoate dehydrogenase
MYRVIQWATGSMGRTALRRIIDHPDLQLVGLFVYDERKDGRDAGEIARRPETGVRATRRIADILALDADVVMHTPRLSDPYSQQNEEVIRLLASGKNVISTAGYHFPSAHGAAYAGPLRAACERGNSTLAGLGLNPGFVAERLALTLTGMCAQLTSITTREIADASGMSSPEFVFGTMGFGSDPQATDITRGPLAALYGELFSEVFHYLAHALETRVATLEPAHQLTLAPADLSIAAGTIRRGTVAATQWCWRATFEDGRRMTHSVIWTADPTLQGAARGAAAHWNVEIEGRPNIRMEMSVADPDASAPHTRAAADATVAIAIRAIADVCAAPSGFFSYRTPAPFATRLRSS